MADFALPYDSFMYGTRSMPNAGHPCDGAGRYLQSAMHHPTPSGYAGMYHGASSCHGMSHGYGYGCVPMQMMPGAALGSQGLGYGVYHGCETQPCAAGLVPSAAGGNGFLDHPLSQIFAVLNANDTYKKTRASIKKSPGFKISEPFRNVP